MKMDDELMRRIQELGSAINEALSESSQIARAIKNIQDAGYDVVLVLEATVGFKKREKPAEPERSVNEPAVTTQDLKFLRSLKIDVTNWLKGRF